MALSPAPSLYRCLPQRWLLRSSSHIIPPQTLHLPSEWAGQLRVFLPSNVWQRLSLKMGFEASYCQYIGIKNLTITHYPLGVINYDSKDCFSLNGQRLMSIGNNEYRYELEQWSRIVAEGSDSANPDSWVEYLPNGSKRTYGASSVRLTVDRSSEPIFIADGRTPTSKLSVNQPPASGALQNISMHSLITFPILTSTTLPQLLAPALSMSLRFPTVVIAISEWHTSVNSILHMKLDPISL